MAVDWNKYREKIIGLGETSLRKSYYPELQEKITELETSHENLQTILNSISDSIIINNKEGKILFLNSQAQVFFNISLEEISLYTVFDISSKNQDLNLLYSYWNEVTQHQSKVIEWISVPVTSGNEIPVQVSLNRIMWNGEVAIVAVVRDFSERKKYENELIVARKKAEESDHLKSVFLANLSHEIRTPMNAILGFSGLLQNADLPVSTKENFIEIIHKSGNHLLSIIDDIIEISKIETNQVKPNYTSVNLNLLMDELYQIFKVTSLANAVELKVTKAIHDSDFIITTDEVKLKQIITNLLSNAFKFTEKGIVEFGYTVEGSVLKFYVHDTGAGISRENFGIIFERFRQVENDITTIKGGSGLGLAISKAYVQMLGGAISVDSELNVGSTFTFTIPLNIVSKPKFAEDQKVEAFAQSGGTSILIAEDDELNFLYLFEALSKYNFRLTRAKNGKEVLDILGQDNQVKIVLMDIKMPVMNGYESFQILQQQYPQLPVIAQTAYALHEDEERIKKAGFHGFISKPINLTELVNMMNRLIK